MSHSLGIAPTAVTLPAPDVNCGGTHVTSLAIGYPQMHHSLRILTSLLAILFLIAACSPIAPGTTDAPSEEERLRVVASLSPIKNIVYNIGGDRIELVGILPPGVDPHTFEPRPSDAVKVAEADLIFLNGMHLDETTLKLAEANLKEGAEIIELAAAVAGPDELLYGIEHHHGHAEEDGHDDDEHGHAEEDGDDEHGHDEEEGEPDPHLLLDPNFVIRYAKVVFVTLSAHDPDNRDFYEANFNEYTARLLALDEAIQATTATIPESNRRLLTYHDSFGYFAIRYGYTVIGAIQPTDTSQPSAQEVAALIVQLLDEDAPAIFGSAQFPADVLEQIAAATGATVRTLRDEDLPGEPGDPEHTYIGMMVENLRTLADSLGGDSSLMDGVDVGNVPDSE